MLSEIRRSLQMGYGTFGPPRVVCNVADATVLVPLLKLQSRYSTRSENECPGV